MSIVKPGKYAAHPERLNEEMFAHVYENDNGNLLLRMAFRLDESGHVLQHWSVLAKGGELQTRTLDTLKARYGWDGVDIFWFEQADLSHVPVEAVIEDEPDRNDPSKVWSRIKWINDPGGRGGGSYAPKHVDRRALSAKYGSLFRAVAGPQPLKPAAKASVAPPAPPAAPKPPPAKAAPVAPSTLNECWEAMGKTCSGDPPDQVTAAWYAILEEACPNKTQDDFEGQDWGLVKARIQKMAEARDQIQF